MWLWLSFRIMRNSSFAVDLSVLRCKYMVSFVHKLSFLHPIPGREWPSAAPIHLDTKHRHWLHLVSWCPSDWLPPPNDTSMCQSFCPQGKGSLYDVPSFLTETTPPPLTTWTGTPRQETPRQSPLYRDPQTETPSNGGHCSGRYASYWNAFLFINIFTVVAYENFKISQIQLDYFVQSTGTTKKCSLRQQL